MPSRRRRTPFPAADRRAHGVRLATWRTVAARRNGVARLVRSPGGPFRQRIVRSVRVYRRHPKHRARALAEAWPERHEV